DVSMLPRLGAGDTRLVHDVGARVLPAHRIGHADHAAVGHVRVAAHRVLDLLGADAVTRGLDEVVLARQEPDVALLVHGDEVAGPAPPLPDGLPLPVRIAPVHGAGRAPGDEQAHLARLAVPALVVHDAELVAGHGGADGAGLHAPGGGRGDEGGHHFRGPEPFVDLEP